MLSIYGIKNCNTVKKSIEWLKNNRIDYEFFDVKKNILNSNLIESWSSNLPKQYNWENLINKSGLTWRNLSAKDKKDAQDLNGAVNLILKKPSVMKRPIVSKNNKIITIGFDENLFKETYL